MHESKILAQFDKCPWCGGTRRLGDHIMGIARERGLVTPDFHWYPVRSDLQPPIDPLRTPLIGSTYPVAAVCTDFCLECGRSYTVQIVEGSAQILNTQIGRG
jgi:hypothetical protein